MSAVALEGAFQRKKNLMMSSRTSTQGPHNLFTDSRFVIYNNVRLTDFCSLIHASELKSQYSFFISISIKTRLTPSRAHTSAKAQQSRLIKSA